MDNKYIAEVQRGIIINSNPNYSMCHNFFKRNLISTVISGSFGLENTLNLSDDLCSSDILNKYLDLKF